MIGVLLLSIILIIEYYNKVVFNNEYLVSANIILSEEINYLLRITLWRIHLATGILLAFIFVFSWVANKDSNQAKYLLYITILIAISGTINFAVQSDILHVVHSALSIVACGIFITITALNFSQKDINAYE